MFGIGMLGVIIIGFVLVLTSFINWVSIDHRDRVGSTITTFILSTVVGVGIYFIGLLGIHCGFINNPGNVAVSKAVNEYNIKSLKPVESIRGSFVLGSGNISSDGYFYTLIDTGNGTFKKEKFPCHSTFLKETGGTKITVYKTTYTNERYTFWTGEKEIREDISYLIEVPKGTIIEEYQVM